MRALPGGRQWSSLGLLLIIGLLWWWQVPPFNLIALKFNDLNFALHRDAPNPQVVMVSVDERSVNHYGRWPWDRAVFAEGLEPLTDASVVLFDLVLSEPTTAEADRALAERIAALDNVICGFFFRSQASEGLPAEAHAILHESALERITLHRSALPGSPYIEANTVPLLQNCSGSAAFSTLLDADALTRRYPLALNFNGELYPSLGVQALRYHLNRDLEMHERTGWLRAQLGEQAIPVEQLGLVKLNFYPTESYRQIPFIDLAQGRVPRSEIAGKIVILGISEAGVTDLRASPLGNTPGPLMHYTFIANVLDNAMITHYRWLDALALVLLGALPLIAVSLVANVLPRALLYLGASVLFLGLGKLAYLASGLWLDSFYPLLALLALGISNELQAYRRSEKESRFILDAFKSYVSPQLLKELTRNHQRLSLGGEEREVTLLFSDIRGFTTLSEALDSTRLVQLLNTCFDPLTRVIVANGGMLDKYIGDAIMAIFNAPVDLPEHPRAAARSALEMIRTVEQLNHALEQQQLPPIAIGIGLNTGDAVVGNMGSSLRFNYTAIGDAVNLASRLETQTKAYRCHIIVSEATAMALGNEFLLRRLDKVRVKGKHQAVQIYELMDDGERNRRIKTDFEIALTAYEAGRFEEAEAGFRRCAQEHADATAEVFVERCHPSPIPAPEQRTAAAPA